MVKYTAYLSLSGDIVELSPYRAAISVSNVNEVSKWYQDVLGFQFSRRMEFEQYGVNIVILEKNGFGLEFIEKAGSKFKKERIPDLQDMSLLRGFTKIGFLVDNIDHTADALKESGVKIVYDVTDDPEDNSSWMIIEDPDGNIIQLFEVPK